MMFNILMKITATLMLLTTINVGVFAECLSSTNFLNALKLSLDDKTKYSLYYNDNKVLEGKFNVHQSMGRLLTIELMNKGVVDNVYFFGNDSHSDNTYVFANVVRSYEKLFSDVYRDATFEPSTCLVSWSFVKEDVEILILANASTSHTSIQFDASGTSYKYIFD